MTRAEHTDASPRTPGRLSRYVWLQIPLKYALTAGAVAASLGFWLAVKTASGMGLPPFITFYPIIMLTALLAGLGPGLFATVLASCAVAYWIMPPVGHFSFASPVDRLALALFVGMGVLMSAFAELFRRSRGKAAAYDRDAALLEASRERAILANLLDHASQPFAVGYPDGRLGRINHAYEHLTGYTAAELQSLDWSATLTPPEWCEMEKQKLAELHRTGQPVRYEKEYRRKDGSRVPVELLVHLVCDAEGQPEYYYSFLTDISERQQTEAALRQFSAELERRVAAQTEEIRQANETLEARVAARAADLEAAGERLRASRLAALGLMEDAVAARKEAERNAEAVGRSEALLRSVTDNTEDLIFVKDTASRMLFVNPAASRAFGWRPEELLGLTDAEWHGDAAQAAAFMADDRRVMESRRTESVEEAFASPHGLRVFHTTKAPRLDADGRVTGVVGIARDITEQKRAEDALRESEESVRRKLESVLAPEGELGVLELGDLVDTAALQRLMDDFYPLTQVPVAIIDLKGRVLVGAGWQDICTRFHRVHAAACRHCIESDLELSAGLAAGEHRLYKCKNNLWDMATPIFVAGQHVGNIFTGQFFFEGETADIELFRAQARTYGFDEEAYLAALDRVPRLQRETVERGMAFFLKLADMIARLGFSNVKLARLLAERDRLTETLRESESFYRQTLESVPGMTFTTQPDGYCDYQSQQWVEFTGVPMADHLGDGWNRLLHPDDRPRAYAAWCAAVEGRAPYDLEYRVRKHDGAYEWFKVRGRPIRNDAGEIVRWFGTAINVDSLIHAQAAVRHLNEQLEQRVLERTSELESANRELEAFCYSVSHDLRTPLRSIDGFSQATLEDYGERLDNTGRDYLNRVRNGCRQMDQLIDDLLRLSRVTRDQMCREPVDLTALAQAAICPLQEREPARVVDIRIAPGLTAIGDSRLLQAALFNLLANAWKFTAKTPAAVIEVGAEDGGQRSEIGESLASVSAPISDLSPASLPVFYVRDNGVGFDMRYAGKLFNAFQRLHTAQEFPGTGIGLATVARIIRRHGGRIWAKAAPGCGATFYFTLAPERVEVHNVGK
jgi:PAS domain S-box-containing protein